MKKRILSIFTAFAMALSIAPVTALAARVPIDGPGGIPPEVVIVEDIDMSEVENGDGNLEEDGYHFEDDVLTLKDGVFKDLILDEYSNDFITLDVQGDVSFMNIYCDTINPPDQFNDRYDLPEISITGNGTLTFNDMRYINGVNINSDENLTVMQKNFDNFYPDSGSHPIPHPVPGDGPVFDSLDNVTFGLQTDEKPLIPAPGQLGIMPPNMIDFDVESVTLGGNAVFKIEGNNNAINIGSTDNILEKLLSSVWCAPCLYVDDNAKAVINSDVLKLSDIEVTGNGKITTERKLDGGNILFNTITLQDKAVMNLNQTLTGIDDVMITGRNVNMNVCGFATVGSIYIEDAKVAVNGVNPWGMDNIRGFKDDLMDLYDECINEEEQLFVLMDKIINNGEAVVFANDIIIKGDADVSVSGMLKESFNEHVADIEKFAPDYAKELKEYWKDGKIGNELVGIFTGSLTVEEGAKLESVADETAVLAVNIYDFLYYVTSLISGDGYYPIIYNNFDDEYDDDFVDDGYNDGFDDGYTDGDFDDFEDPYYTELIDLEKSPVIVVNGRDKEEGKVLQQGITYGEESFTLNLSTVLEKGEKELEYEEVEDSDSPRYKTNFAEHIIIGEKLPDDNDYPDYPDRHEGGHRLEQVENPDWSREDYDKPEEPEVPEVPEMPEIKTPFTDVANHWAEESIAYVYNNGILVGTAENLFSPEMTLTRGMFVTALGRMAKADAAQYADGKFADVSSDMYYANYVNWASSMGIVNGISATEFAPEKEITLQEMAVIILNYMKAMNIEVPATLREFDVDNVDDWARAAVITAFNAGFTAPDRIEMFSGANPATRAEAAYAIHHLMESIMNK